MILCRLVKTPGWTTSRKYCFSLLFIAVVWAKLLHIYSHRNSLPLVQFLLWGPTFFLQDALCVLVFRVLTRNFHNRWLRVLAASIVIPASLGTSFMAAANTSFYITTGAEIHWRQARSFHRDFASVKTLLAGLTGLLMVEALYKQINRKCLDYQKMQKSCSDL